MKSSWREEFALTANERKIALFLVGSFVLGLGIRLYQQTFPDRQQFDYSASDSTFAALSARVPAKEERSSPSSSVVFPVNINRATKKELVRLPGIGDKTAERIVAYREERGAFSAIDDLRKVKGISQSKLEKIKPLITVH